MTDGTPGNSLRYEVTCDDGYGMRMVFNETSTLAAARQMFAAVDRHPLYHTPLIWDRVGKSLVA